MGDDCGVRRNGTCVESFATPLPVLFDWYGNADVVEQQVNEMREVTFAYTKTMAKMGLRTYVI